MMNPEEFRQSIRETFGAFPECSGGCWKFANIMKSLFEGEIYYNNDHFITLIDGVFYDLFGSYKPNDTVRYLNNGSIIEFPVSDFLHIKEFGEANIKRSFL